MYLPNLPPDPKPTTDGHDTSTIVLGEGYMQRPVEVSGNYTNIHNQSRQRMANYAAIPPTIGGILNSFVVDVSVGGTIIGVCASLVAAGFALAGLAIATVIGGLYFALWAQILDYKGMKPIFIWRIILIALGALIVL